MQQVRAVWAKAEPWRAAVLWGVGATLIYWVCAGRYASSDTPDMAYFDQLAKAFLEGRVHLGTPEQIHDLTKFEGNWYVPFLPLPALMMLPFVAVLGVAGFNTVMFAVVVGGLNVALGHVLLRSLDRRGVTSLTASSRHWLTLLWGFSTVHWYAAQQGTVWFVSQVCTVLFVMLAVIFAVRRRPWLAGVALAIALLARPTVVLAAPALLLLVSDERRIRDLARTAWRIAVPLVIAIVCIAGYNQLRFDRPTEFGYRTENVDVKNLAPRLYEHGQFNPIYVPENLWAAFAAGPEWNSQKDEFTPNPWGMSIVLTTPAVLLAGRAGRRREARALWLGVGLVSIPIFLYYNTGWWQFGFRFALDVWPMLLGLVAIGVGTRVRWGWRLAIVAGVLVNFWGMTWFGG